MKFLPLKERFFESIDGILYVFERALEQAGISTNYYRKAKSEGHSRLHFLNHPKDKRFNLVAFESISDDHKEKIIKLFGNPYNFIIREPILNMLERNLAAERFYMNYKTADGKMLPVKRIKQYTRACEWMDMLIKVEDSRNKLIKEMQITVPDFYKHLDDIITNEKNNGADEKFTGNDQIHAKFPTSYRKLKPKVDEYKVQKFELFIDKMTGNKVAAKVNDEHAEAQLLSLCENPNQYDDVLVCMMYNMWASQNDYKLITPETVGVWRRKKSYQITIGREGNSAFNEKYIRQVKGLLPSTPLALIEHDDNNLDFLFQNDVNDKIGKYVSICVVDARTKLLLGKSYIAGRTPEMWQVHHAYLDAMYFIRKLTGAWYLPHEIKADKWASKTLTPFYNKIAKFIPPSHGNKHRGYIEQFFGSSHWKRCQQLVSQGNWSGNNMTAKHRGVNQDLLRDNQKNKNLPIIETAGAQLQIENFFHLLRQMPAFTKENMKAENPEQIFKQQWDEMHHDDKLKISDEQFLLTFGIKHEPGGRQITINNRGLEPQINGHQLSYDLPHADMYNKLIGAKVSIIYDPFDLSRVLATNFDDIRFVAHTAQLTPRALKDTYTGSRTFLNAILHEKKLQVEDVATASDQRKRITDTKFYHPEAMLQAGVMVKEIKNEAETKLLNDTFTQDHEDWLNNNNDFSQYFNS